VAGKALGKVKHYFGRVRTAIIVCQQDGLMVGDTIRIKGHTTDLKLKVDSIMVHGKPLTAVEKGKDVAVRVTGKVRPDDRVYKVKE
jgi:putative protease